MGSSSSLSKPILDYDIQSSFLNRQNSQCNVIYLSAEGYKYNTQTNLSRIIIPLRSLRELR